MSDGGEIEVREERDQRAAEVITWPVRPDPHCIHADGGIFGLLLRCNHPASVSSSSPL
ncbi:uncharacterized protein V6R79_004515 [Siganus canaliculatus]